MTFDLGAAQKAFNIVWQNHQSLEKLSFEMECSTQLVLFLVPLVNMKKEVAFKVLLLKLLFVSVDHYRK